jgi:pSer/pThr/pTyr-binding forkhead associated (FHA) protein
LPKPGEDWLIVETASQDRVDAAAKPVGKLIVREGEANAAEIRMEKARTNIGRVVDVYRAEGLFRRNDLAFEAENEINRSVSREHAHIRYDRAAGEYRLFNDRWYERGVNGGCATWIVRDGMSQEVHRTARGTKLEPGDEIRFGRAVVMFEME